MKREIFPSNENQSNTMTDEKYWDKYWENIKLPKEIRKRNGERITNEVLHVFEKYMPDGRNKTILEIGGAPGQYLAFMNKQLGFQPVCLDYSPVGCQKTIENFQLLGIKGSTIKRDLLNNEKITEKFDVVYSLGLIEHFKDFKSIVGRHCEYLKKNGILVIGVPNLTGIYKPFLKLLAPSLLSKHNLKSMSIDSWDSFESDFKIKSVFKNYIGGFTPEIFNPSGPYLLIRGVFIFAWLINSILKSLIRNLSNKTPAYWKGYLIGVYQKM